MTPARSSLGQEGSAFLRFCAVGAIGFVVDGVVLQVLYAGFGWDPFAARAVSVLVAVTATWVLHRRYTFRSRDPRRLAEWSRFAAVNAAGAGVNVAAYTAVLLAVPATPPLAALAVGSALALIANYAGARLFAFSRTLTPTA